MRRVWVALIALVVFTLAFSPSRSTPPALPEPGVRRVMSTVFGAEA